MQRTLILLLVCLAAVVDHGSAHYYHNNYYWKYHCDPCSKVRCTSRNQKCVVMPDPACTTAPCPVIARCIMDPMFDPCSIGKPMTDAAGTPLTCVTSANCPQDGACITTNIAGTNVNRCCFDPTKCPVKAGRCPFSRDTTTCTNTCNDDGDCATTMKCCNTACNGKKCVAPVSGWWWRGR
ncbi:uncharacterized protein LOC121372284 [Gigantopelta aegis]|uniref:uncharacterized protein LOC121372284 n=1 Tax=Gigantopelta aegis TaxID=1735272 RepID=UPI001B88A5A6|nr:uncharacterized protein LOC121372284 [Gigantopelta aegis]